MSNILYDSVDSVIGEQMLKACLVEGSDDI